MWTVRPATLADLDVLVELNCKLAEETEGLSLHPDTVRAGVFAVLVDPAKGRYFVGVPSAAEGASGASEIAGQLMITTEWTDWRNGVFWWLQSVYVREAVRRRGVFTALLGDLRARAAAEPSFRGLRLYVEEHNTRALATYATHGLANAGYVVLGDRD